MANFFTNFWNNLAPNPKSFTENPPQFQTNYGGIPNFQQTSGVLPGQTPLAPSYVIPKPGIDMKAFLNGFPNVVTITHE